VIPVVSGVGDREIELFQQVTHPALQCRLEGGGHREMSVPPWV
jgi:hypothetical protein